MYEKHYEKYRVNLSNNIKRFRKALGIAQERLALEAGVDRTLVSKIERQIANPSLEILIRLSLSLNVSVSDLLN
jgi:transcriptional regulator with XRE-family HTH domain